MNHGADAAASPLPDGAVVVPADAAPPTPTDASAPDAADGGGDAGASVDASDGGAAVPGNDSGATNDAGKGADSGGSADAGPTSCVAPLTDCNGSCVNEQTDNSNCGGCGAACGVATASCVSGICETWLTQQAWTESSSSANATISHQTDGGHVAEQFRYNDTSTDAYSGQSFTWRATASTSTTVNYAWSYSGFHAYYLAAAGLQAYADGPSGTSTVTLVPTSTVSGNFAFNGTSSLSVTSGYAFGFIASGINDDSTDVLQGEVTITPQ